MKCVVGNRLKYYGKLLVINVNVDEIRFSTFVN